MAEQKQTCSTCRFWLMWNEEGIQPAFGYCRRFPPTSGGEYEVFDESERRFYLGEHLTTPDSGWCGEWQAQNPQTVNDAAVVMARAVLAGDAGAGRALADKLIELIPLPVLEDVAPVRVSDANDAPDVRSAAPAA